MRDPKLDAVMEEIKVLLKKNDLAGVVFVTSPSHTNFLYELTPSWTCARVENDHEGPGLFIRVRSKLADYASREDQKKVMEKTMGMFVSLAQRCESTREDLLKLVMLVAQQKVVIEHREMLEPPR